MSIRHRTEGADWFLSPEPKEKSEGVAPTVQIQEEIEQEPEIATKAILTKEQMEQLNNLDGKLRLELELLDSNLFDSKQKTPRVLFAFRGGYAEWARKEGPGDWAQGVFNDLREMRSRTRPEEKNHLKELENFWQKVREEFKRRGLEIIDSVSSKLTYEEAKASKQYFIYGDATKGEPRLLQIGLTSLGTDERHRWGEKGKIVRSPQITYEEAQKIDGIIKVSKEPFKTEFPDFKKEPGIKGSSVERRIEIEPQTLPELPEFDEIRWAFSSLEQEPEKILLETAKNFYDTQIIQWRREVESSLEGITDPATRQESLLQAMSAFKDGLQGYKFNPNRISFLVKGELNAVREGEAYGKGNLIRELVGAMLKESDEGSRHIMAKAEWLAVIRTMCQEIKEKPDIRLFTIPEGMKMPSLLHNLASKLETSMHQLDLKGLERDNRLRGGFCYYNTVTENGKRVSDYDFQGKGYPSLKLSKIMEHLPMVRNEDMLQAARVKLIDLKRRGISRDSILEILDQIR